MTLMRRNLLMAGRFNNYLVGGNLCNAFVVGSLGAPDDFFLIAAEPSEESSYPLLTGNIIDSEGNLLCRLERNILTLNPGDCSKLLGDAIGYEIHDAAGQFVLRINTRFFNVEGVGESYVTTIEGQFFDKTGAVVFDASSDEDGPRLVANTKLALGFAAGGGFGLVQDYAEEELEIARIALATGGTVYEALRGVVDGIEFSLDGKALLNAVVANCHIHVKTGNWEMSGCALTNDEFDFEDEAAKIKWLVEQVQGSQGAGSSA